MMPCFSRITLDTIRLWKNLNNRWKLGKPWGLQRAIEQRQKHNAKRSIKALLWRGERKVKRYK